MTYDRAIWTAFHSLPYQRFGFCRRCGRDRDNKGRLLWLGGRVHGGLVCLDCFEERGAPGRRLAA
jgi:hypothetical protein